MPEWIYSISSIKSLNEVSQKHKAISVCEVAFFCKVVMVFMVDSHWITLNEQKHFVKPKSKWQRYQHLVQNTQTKHSRKKNNINSIYCEYTDHEHIITKKWKAYDWNKRRRRRREKSFRLDSQRHGQFMTMRMVGFNACTISYLIICYGITKCLLKFHSLFDVCLVCRYSNKRWCSWLTLRFSSQNDLLSLRISFVIFQFFSS